MKSIEELADMLSSSPRGEGRYKGSELLAGLASERDRLGTRPYLVAVYRQEFDYDGLTEYVELLESFEDLRDAENYAEREAAQRLSSHLSGDSPYCDGKRWALVPDAEMRELHDASDASGLRTISEQTYKVISGDYDRIYCSVRVIGPFSGKVVDQGLIDFVNQRFEMWGFFVRAGEGGPEA